MVDRTSNLGLLKLGNGDSLAVNNYEFVRGNMDTLDQAVSAFGPGHHHNGVGASPPSVAVPATVALTADPGTFLSTTTYYYKYSFQDANGGETEASPLTQITTSALVSKPTSGPVLASTPTGGTLPPGRYEYVLSAYKDAVTLETPASPLVQLYVPGPTSTSQIELSFPVLPGGATGFNVYRRGPGESQFVFLVSRPAVSGVVADYMDTGSVTPNNNRLAPNNNTTSQSESILVTLPLAVPVGYTAKIFRTDNTGDWSYSLLAVLATAGSVDFLDTGASTSEGSPRVQSQIFGSPSKIDLTNYNEVQGVLPPAAVVTPDQTSFLFDGAVVPGRHAKRFRPLHGTTILKDVVLDLDFMEMGTGRTDPVAISLYKGTGELASTATYTEITPGVIKSLSSTDNHATFSLGGVELTSSDFLVCDVTASDAQAYDLEVGVTMWRKMPEVVSV